jgi:hypothetical protein
MFILSIGHHKKNTRTTDASDDSIGFVYRPEAA